MTLGLTDKNGRCRQKEDSVNNGERRPVCEQMPCAPEEDAGPSRSPKRKTTGDSHTDISNSHTGLGIPTGLSSRILRVCVTLFLRKQNKAKEKCPPNFLRGKLKAGKVHIGYLCKTPLWCSCLWIPGTCTCGRVGRPHVCSDSL